MIDYTAALCRRTDPALFFPEKGENDKVRSALAVCAECPTRDACRDDNLDEQFGVWGGTTAFQRMQLRRGVKPIERRPPPPKHERAPHPTQRACKSASHDWTRPGNVLQRSDGRYYYCGACQRVRSADRRAANRRKVEAAA